MRTVRKILFGKHFMDTWYSSSYPVEKINSEETLFLCSHCLDYKNTMSSLIEHRCPLRNPPGRLIYKDVGKRLAMWEVRVQMNMYMFTTCISL